MTISICGDFIARQMFASPCKEVCLMIRVGVVSAWRQKEVILLQGEYFAMKLDDYGSKYRRFEQKTTGTNKEFSSFQFFLKLKMPNFSFSSYFRLKFFIFLTNFPQNTHPWLRPARTFARDYPNYTFWSQIDPTFETIRMRRSDRPHRMHLEVTWELFQMALIFVKHRL